MRVESRWLLAWLAFALVAGSLFAQLCDADDRVARVIDGDTVQLDSGVVVRLEGIDAPERAQPYGPQAKQVLERLVLGKHVTVDGLGTGRIADLHYEAGDRLVSVARSLVASGAAWVYTRYEGRDGERLKELEARARSQTRGVWGASSPIAPWEWRRGRRAVCPNGMCPLSRRTQ